MLRSRWKLPARLVVGRRRFAREAARDPTRIGIVELRRFHIGFDIAELDIARVRRLPSRGRRVSAEFRLVDEEQRY
jgi:hypothetical protein